MGGATAVKREKARMKLLNTIQHPRELKKLSVDQLNKQLIAWFDERDVAYDLRDLDELVHAYACSIHKAQGSEFPVVVLPLHTQHYVMLQRNLLYTALTRGKKLVVVVGSRRALAIAVKNNKTEARRTRLTARLAAAEERRD